MNCPRCGNPMEPNPDVGWICMGPDCQDTLTLTISMGREGFKVDGAGMDSSIALRMLYFAYIVVHRERERIARHQAATS